ncbi:hypothetical protein P43SY_006016 [Pythium insidiosum]|uniref:Uncharacterized protein n=1 Tax=Pythium insidiosum TaxID=114742 RepID=A0AAD5LYW5_PYTIN|nr:hypothetical protein P43SY_006016 [Pythium insidiosum]KAJ0398995.1 hypothetical protein ATCC90586_005619 [Pythium insidiosum]
MDWQTNLATIIKHTDANLEQQLRQFADVSVGLTTCLPEAPRIYPTTRQNPKNATGGGNHDEPNIASAFLRESLASMRRPDEQFPIPAPSTQDGG